MSIPYAQVVVETGVAIDAEEARKAVAETQRKKVQEDRAARESLVNFEKETIAKNEGRIADAAIKAIAQRERNVEAVQVKAHTAALNHQVQLTNEQLACWVRDHPVEAKIYFEKQRAERDALEAGKEADHIRHLEAIERDDVLKRERDAEAAKVAKVQGAIDAENRQEFVVTAAMGLLGAGVGAYMGVSLAPKGKR